MRKIFNQTNYISVKSFTYYIPAPPGRKTGYQEKEFDHIVAYLIGKGFDIIDFKMQACANETSSGVWILCLLGAKTQLAAKMDIDIDYTQVASEKEQYIKTDPSIEHEH